MSMRCGRLAAVALSAVALCGGPLFAADADKKATREVASFGTLQAPKVEEARQQAQAWLKSVGKTDAASQQAFAAIWATDRPLLDKVARTLELGDANAAKLLAEARDPAAPAPTSVPALLKDTKLPTFFRANLALAYAKALCQRKVYDETIEALKQVKAEQVVDPAAYFFTRAVAEYTLMMKNEADSSVLRLLDDVADAPERYKMVAALMHFDMMTWQDKDLAWISRKMNIIRDRLELERAGQKTQTIQKEVLVRLDEMIKELENKQKQGGGGGGGANGGNCPPGGQSGPPSGSQPNGTPAADSGLPSGNNAGQIDPKRLKEIADVWGSLPEKERAKAILELTRDMPEKYREAIKTYLQQISNKTTP
jgi:hypothetical protein